MTWITTILLLIAGHMICLSLCSPLTDYINQPDTHYKYDTMSVIKKKDYDMHILNMTSQKWMDEKFSSRSIWWHYVIIIIPKEVKVKDTVFLFVSDGKNTDKRPNLEEPFIDLIILMAISTKTVAALVMQVPNQPIIFHSDPYHRNNSEDGAIAVSMKTYLMNPKQPNALIHLPMTKAIVRTMDTVDDFNQKIRGHRINKFFLTGASKRGWTVWLTAAVDPRVVGMSPIVFDLLNMKKSLHHHFRSLGGWSFALNKYVENNVTQYLDTPFFQQMSDIIDPFAYKEKYKMPTLIIKATGDEFFLVDETNVYFKELTEPKYLSVLENCEHTLIGHITEALMAMRSFYLNVISRARYPQLHWTMNCTQNWGAILLTVDVEPLQVIVYHAHALQAQRRDFRLFIKNPKSHGAMLQLVLWSIGPHAAKLSHNMYEARMKVPHRGWTAFYMEATFPGVYGSVLQLSTEVFVIPDTLPFPDCRGAKCKGTIV